MSERLLQIARAPFQAARRLPGLPQGHRAQGLHGHGFLAWAAAPLCVGGDAEASRRALAAAVAVLDYQDLNRHLPQPSDAHLAGWLRERLSPLDVAALGVRGAPDQGVELDGLDQVEDRARVWRAFRFEAAHQLPRVPPGHPCGRLHGHGFGVTLGAALPPDQEDALLGERLAELWAPLGAQLHLACLNELPGLENSTSERLAQWLWSRLKPQLAELAWVRVRETATAGCQYDGAHYRIWKERRFESALRLSRAPDGDPRRLAHGHSYRIRLHLTAPLDEVLGWTLDYGVVSERFRPVYEQLDHRLLNELPGLVDPDLGRLALWIRDRVAPHLPALDRIDLEDTPAGGVTLAWGATPPAHGL